MADRETWDEVYQKVQVVGGGEGWNNRAVEKVWGKDGRTRLLLEVMEWGRGQVMRQGLQKLTLAGQVEVLPKMLNNRSLSDEKPSFYVSVCDSLPYHAHFLCSCTICHSENHAELNWIFFSSRIFGNRSHCHGKEGKATFSELLLPCPSSLALFKVFYPSQFLWAVQSYSFPLQLAWTSLFCPHKNVAEVKSSGNIYKCHFDWKYLAPGN